MAVVGAGSARNTSVSQGRLSACQSSVSRIRIGPWLVRGGPLGSGPTASSPSSRHVLMCLYQAFSKKQESCWPCEYADGRQSARGRASRGEGWPATRGDALTQAMADARRSFQWCALEPEVVFSGFRASPTRAPSPAHELEIFLCALFELRNGSDRVTYCFLHSLTHCRARASHRCAQAVASGEATRSRHKYC